MKYACGGNNTEYNEYQKCIQHFLNKTFLLTLATMILDRGIFQNSPEPAANCFINANVDLGYSEKSSLRFCLSF